MTFPAWFDFARDSVMLRHPATLAVYAHLVQLPNAFHEPQAIKAWWLAEHLRFEKETILDAFNLLVERGYLNEHSRGRDNVRRFTVCIAKAKPAA